MPKFDNLYDYEKQVVKLNALVCLNMLTLEEKHLGISRSLILFWFF